MGQPMVPQPDEGKPRVWLYLRPGGYREDTVAQAVATLREQAEVFVGNEYVFSLDAYLFQITVEFLVSTLSNISASVIYNSLNYFATAAKERGEEKITCKFTLRHRIEPTVTTRRQEIFVDVSSNDPESFYKAINCVMSNIDRKELMLVYNEEKDNLEDIIGL